MQLDLDDPKTLSKLDPEGMTDLIVGLPEQIEEAYDIGMKAEVPGEYADVGTVVISGLGGSAIGGDLLRSLTLAESKVPVSVNRITEYLHTLDLILCLSHQAIRAIQKRP